MQLWWNLYRGIEADKLSADNTKQEKETSYAHSVAHVTGSPVTLSLAFINIFTVLYYQISRSNAAAIAIRIPNIQAARVTT